MRIPTASQALPYVNDRLAELLGVTPANASNHRALRTRGADAVIEIAGTEFIVAWKNSGATAPVAAAIEEVQRLAAAAGRSAIPLVAVPFMGPVGRDRCKAAGVAWLDLSGNALILAPGIHVRIEGQPNRFKRQGRPSSAFAPKSARIARWLLMHPHQSMLQQEIARATSMDKGFTSRIIARLEQDGLIDREPDGSIRPRDPGLLLDTWHEDYDFLKHQIIPGHVPARSGDELLGQVVSVLRAEQVQHAATGLAAAWLMSGFAGFRLVTIYVADRQASRLLGHLGFREEERGANVWLVVPRDEGVFHGVADRSAVACVHPVQAYLDLKAQPERASEAAAHLRTSLLNQWGADA
jgi:hypothetical protein